MSTKRHRIIPKGEDYNPWENEYLTIEVLEAAQFRFLNNDVNYSIDGGTTWTTLAAGTYTASMPVGTKIKLKGELVPITNGGVGQITFNKKFNAMGNPMSLLFGDNFIGKKDLTGYERAFYRLFYGCSTLQDVGNLVLCATTLEVRCYNQMFQSCTSIKIAMALPAKVMKEQCYRNMFTSCSSLLKTPKLPASVLASYCYAYMFEGCTSLIKTYNLNAKTLEGYCYFKMFYNCRSLTKAPNIEATYVNAGSCCREMFANCVSLTKAPALNSLYVGSSCYYVMFDGCTNLSYVKAMFVNAPGSATSAWLRNVSPTGVFVKNRQAAWNVSSADGIPSGWTVEYADE